MSQHLQSGCFLKNTGKQKEPFEINITTLLLSSCDAKICTKITKQKYAIVCTASGEGISILVPQKINTLITGGLVKFA